MLSRTFRMIFKVLRHSYRYHRSLSLDYEVNGTQYNAEGVPVLVLFSCGKCRTTLAVKY